MIQTSDPTQPARPTYSDDELNRMLGETRALLTVAMKETAARLVPTHQPDENRALLEGVRQELAEVRAAFAARSPRELREDARFVLDALRLFRVCPRERCRKAQTCQGKPERCHARRPCRRKRSPGRRGCCSPTACRGCRWSRRRARSSGRPMRAGSPGSRRARIAQCKAAPVSPGPPDATDATTGQVS